MLQDKLFRILALASALLLPQVAMADEVSEQIDIGLSAYKDGELRQAVQELQYAIAQIQELLNNSYTQLLPEPLQGWEADAADAQTAGMAMMGGGTQITREYRKSGSKESVTIQLIADSPFLQAMSMMLSNPMLLQSDPNTRLYRHGRHRGMIKQQGSGRIEISLLLANRILVQVTGTGVNDKQPVETYLKALDLKKVEKAFSI